ncbi:DUF7255 family protein [Salinimicrobium sp. GXAS 041]|uniref:DUF7255 family protein n=1 Tax=Salinimicrobium sp. GXAS 041 TaxID=3400806 RepID=UPI003C74FFCB
MSKEWAQLKDLYKKDHLSKGLKSPQIRLNALMNLENIFLQSFPEIIDEPKSLVQYSKTELKEKLSAKKGNPLNSAESSVINGLYNFLPYLNSTTDQEPLTTPSEETGTLKREKKPKPEENVKINFYRQIGELVQEIKGENLEFSCSQSIPGLKSTPLPEQFPNTWHFLAEVYRKINGAELDLDEVIIRNKANLKMSRQEADVLIFSPYLQIVEYDEEQHFNQFRAITLESPLYEKWKSFDLSLYKKLCEKQVKPGSKKSGFYFLKSPDPLFPEKPGKEKQDNRLRQRAFRDMVKDAWSIENGWLPVIRIHAQLVGWKRKELNNQDWKILEKYLTGLE